MHSFKDTNNVINGQAYYYAVVAYDHGDSLGIPPSETGKKITVDPITGSEIFDINTVKVIPGPRTAGYIDPGIPAVDKVSGYANGTVEFTIINDINVVDEKYTLTFSDTLNIKDTTIIQKNYSVLGERNSTESFYLFDTKYATLSRQNILDDGNLVVEDKLGNIYKKDIDYILDFEKGKIARTENSSMPNNSEYQITYLSYSVYQSLALNFEDSNPVFDGIKLKVFDHPALVFNAEESKWNTDHINLPFRVFLRTAAKPLPADYIVTFSEQPISTAKKYVPGKGFIDIPVKYKVEDVTTGVPIEVMTNLQEPTITNDSAWTIGEEIVFYVTGSSGGQGQPITWSLMISESEDSVQTIPTDGDFLLLYTDRPFTEDDAFTLTTKAGYVDNRLAASGLDNIYVVPNPYVGASSLEPANKLPGQNRGERRIYFENLPMKCTIRIYTLSGELVNQVEHDSGFDNGREYWNLLNKDGFSVSYGVYLAHIDAPGVGEKLIKFALIK